MQPWNLVFLVAFAVYVAIRGAFERRVRDNVKVLRRADAADRVLLGFVLAGALLLPVVYLATPWLGFADYRQPALAPWVGTALAAAALWLFWRAHADLGLNWSVTLEVRQGHELVRRGVYRRIRHPMYAAIWLFDLGQGLLLANWLAGWSALLTFAALYFVRVPKEERLMCEVFGDDYRAYMQATGRLLPRRRN